MEKFLLESGEFVDKIDVNGQTALHFAAMDNKLSRVKYLISRGADVNLEDDRDRTPLHWAAFFNKNDTYYKVIEVLVENGAKLNLKDNLKKTPLHYLVELNSHKAIRLLLKHRVDVRSADDPNETLIAPLFRSLAWFEASKDRRKTFVTLLEYYPHPIVSSLFNSSVNLQPYLCVGVIRHYSKLLALRLPIDVDIFQMITRMGDVYRLQYMICRQELLNAQDNRVGESRVTFFDLLFYDEAKFKSYADDFKIIDLEIRKCANCYSIYGTEMVKNVDKEVKRRELLEKSSALLSECLRTYNLTESIIKDILNCLTKKDLKKFVSNK